MLRHLGFVAMALSIDSATNRTCRLKNATPERLRELIGSNLAELERVLEFCGLNGIRRYRVSSELIPFASHPVNTLAWWNEFADRFARMAALIRGHRIVVSMHPGQFTVLNSPNAKVVRSSIEEVAWHAKLLGLLGTGPEGKMVLHVGGAFGDKPAALDRFARVVADLPDDHRRRIVIENDEHVYAIDEVLDLSARTGLPVIYDNLHDRIHRGADDPARWLPAVFATWGPSDGVPKVHFSSQAPGGRPGAHADFIDPDEFASFLAAVPTDRSFDAMLECKQKDVALFRLRRELAARGLGESEPGATEPTSLAATGI